MRLVPQVSKLLAAACVLAAASASFAADGGAWTVGKSSGEVWLTSSGAQPASLKQEELLKPGDTVRTGRNGRVLLRRGEETMLISPNSVVGMPAESKEGLSTTIVQQAGSILLEVEKRNVKHFEVETPYLAAVVKGTQFRVTINAGSTSVDVIRGQVEVADFRSGQIAQVMPGQHATSFMDGKVGLSLSGSGTFNPIEQGKPRASTIERVPVPKSGLSLPRNAVNGHAIHALGTIDKGIKTAGAPTQSHQAETHAPKVGVVRISSSLGEVKLNFHKVTNGLAHGAVAPGRVRNAASASTGIATVWSEGATSTTTTANSTTVTAAVVSSSAPVAATTTTPSSGTTTIAATTSGPSGDLSGGSSASGGSGTGATGGSGSNGNNGNSGNGNDGNNGHHYGWWWGRGHH